MVSYNDCDFIRGLYAGYHITTATRINNLAQRYDGGCEFPEVLITNYDPKERQRVQPVQMSLFGMSGDEDHDGGSYVFEETAAEKEGEGNEKGNV